MPDRSRKKRPRDPNQLGKLIVDLSVGEADEPAPKPEDEGKDPAAVALGRRGGLKGGKARAAALTKSAGPRSRRKPPKLAGNRALEYFWEYFS